MSRKSYSDEFKQQAVQLALSGEESKAHDLVVTLYTRIAKFDLNAPLIRLMIKLKSSARSKLTPK